MATVERTEVDADLVVAGQPDTNVVAAVVSEAEVMATQGSGVVD
ncbi:hypothetical protein OSH32_01585 [Mycobacterium ulcerans]|nr:hypothetical protein [Mycobacterium ulcerans]